MPVSMVWRRGAGRAVDGRGGSHDPAQRGGGGGSARCVRGLVAPRGFPAGPQAAERRPPTPSPTPAAWRGRGGPPEAAPAPQRRGERREEVAAGRGGGGRRRTMRGGGKAAALQPPAEGEEARPGPGRGRSAARWAVAGAGGLSPAAARGEAAWA